VPSERMSITRPIIRANTARVCILSFIITATENRYNRRSSLTHPGQICKHNCIELYR
jgi:hypothetical protein